MVSRSGLLLLKGLSNYEIKVSLTHFKNFHKDSCNVTIEKDDIFILSIDEMT